MNEHSSKYTPKVLELVSKEIAGYFTGPEIVKILEKAGLTRDVIQYPNTKWWTINEAFVYIQNNKKNPDNIISAVIMDFLHPLNHNLNEQMCKELVIKVQPYLNYDDFHIQDNGRAGYYVLSGEELYGDVETPLKKEIEEREVDRISDNKKIKQNKDVTKTLRDNHQAFMDVIEIFCQNTKKPTKELNDAYLFLLRKLEKTTSKLNLDYYELYLYVPFSDLYTAEIEWNGSGSLDDIKLGQSLSWDAVRPFLYKAHSNIIKIHSLSGDEDKMTDDEKHLEEIATLISQKRTTKISQKLEPVKKLEILHKYENNQTRQKSLRSSVIRFDDTIPAIFVDEVEIPIPEYGKEHFFCRAMWKRKQSEAIDWSKVYNDMENKNADFLPDKELWRYVYDAKNDVNKRIKEITKTTENLFDWKEKTVKRLY